MKNNQTERIVAGSEKSDDKRWDFTLRPQNLKEYIGQEEIKRNLDVLMAAAQKRAEPIEHVLLYGGPGLGKTTLAYVIANEMKSHIRVTSGAALEKAGDLAAILSNLEKGDALFIDEIHRLPKIIEEILYSAMEEFALDIVIGKGPSARTLRLDLPPFTLIGATTKMSLLSAPLRDRFGAVYHLNFYTNNEIEQIIHRSAKILKILIDEESSRELSKRARKTPRIANRLLRRVRDYAQVNHLKEINLASVLGTLEMLEIDDMGLDRVDRTILCTILEKFKGGPVGLNTIAACISEEMNTLEDIYEPYLMQIGFLERTPRGRKITDSAVKYLNGIDNKKRLI